MTHNTKWTIPDDWQRRYVNAINQAILSKDEFNIFRKHPHYNMIVPNCVPPEEAKVLYDELSKFPTIMEKFDIIKQMDTIGSPELHQPWNTCARNFKYMHAALRIKENFGNDIKRVVEIGVGYGGLCFTLQQYFSVEKYKLVDIDCVVRLAKLFLSKLTDKDDSFYDSGPPYDICISECALTELDDTSIQHYYDEYIKQSKYLYIRTNFNNPTRLRNFIQLLELDFDIEMVDDIPGDNTKTVAIGWINRNATND